MVNLNLELFLNIKDQLMLPGLGFGASRDALTPPRDLPAPGRRQTLYVALRLLQSPVFLVNSRLGLSTAARLRSRSKSVHVRAGTPSPEVTGPLCRVP